jgi:hypothetical protein
MGVLSSKLGGLIMMEGFYLLVWIASMKDNKLLKNNLLSEVK